MRIKSFISSRFLQMFFLLILQEIIKMINKRISWIQKLEIINRAALKLRYVTEKMFAKHSST